MNTKYTFKNYLRIFLLLTGLGIFAMPSQAQVQVCLGEEVCMSLPNTVRGSLLWQESLTGSTWTDVSGATSDTLCVIANVTKWFRAGAVEGTCDTVWSDTIQLAVNPNPVADAGPDNIICEGESITIGGSPAGSGGTGSLTYSWAPATGLSSTTAGNPVATPSATTDYMLSVTDSLGCMDMDTTTVTVNQAPTVVAGADTTVNCGDAVSLSANVTGGTAPYSYSWTPAGGLSNPTSANPSFTASNTQTYTVMVTDANGCMSMDSTTITVTGGSPPGTQTFSYTGAPQFLIVPCVDSVTIQSWGAQGGFDGTAAGGQGGYATGKLAVNAGDTLWVYVGGQGTSGPGSGQNCGLAGGWNGGGNTGITCCSNAGGGAGAGGGASDVRYGGITLSDRVIVGAGGGGAGSNNAGATGGGLVGTNGGTYTGGVGSTATGGTQTAGGVVGGHFTGHSCSIGTDGSFGQGGIGDGNDGGGGGGGWYGGGGGPNNGGGAGGSSYIGGVVGGSTTTGGRSGNGQVIISW